MVRKTTSGAKLELLSCVFLRVIPGAELATEARSRQVNRNAYFLASLSMKCPPTTQRWDILRLTPSVSLFSASLPRRHSTRQLLEQLSCASFLQGACSGKVFSHQVSQDWRGLFPRSASDTLRLHFSFPCVVLHFGRQVYLPRLVS